MDNSPLRKHLRRNRPDDAPFGRFPFVTTYQSWQKRFHVAEFPRLRYNLLNFRKGSVNRMGFDKKPILEHSFVCDSCGKSFTVPAEAAGETIICPHCQKPLPMDDLRRSEIWAGKILANSPQEWHKEK